MNKERKTQIDKSIYLKEDIDNNGKSKRLCP